MGYNVSFGSVCEVLNSTAGPEHTNENSNEVMEAQREHSIVIKLELKENKEEERCTVLN